MICVMINLCSIVATLTFLLMPAPTTLFDAQLNPVVTLPAGYFLMLADAPAPDGYLSVRYDDLGGYVREADVTRVDYRPVTKYETTVRFSCDNDGQPVNLRAAPDRTAEILTVLPASAKGRCYGTLDGGELIDGAGNVWYYVSFDALKGYVYRAHVKVDPTPPNIIEKEPDDVQPTVTEPADEPESPMPTVAAIIFIVVLCIPVPFIMVYLFRKPKDR